MYVWRNSYDGPPASTIKAFDPVEISSVTPSITSGFPYHQKLFELHVSPEEWETFGDDVVQSLQLSIGARALAWTVGVSVGTVSLVGAPGYYAGKAMQERSRANKVRRSMKNKGELDTALRRWNVTFAERGFRVRIVLPRVKQGTEEDDKSNTSGVGSKKDKKKKKKKDEEKIYKTHYRLIIEDIRTQFTQRGSSYSEVAELADDAAGSRSPAELDTSLGDKLASANVSREPVFELQG